MKRSDVVTVLVVDDEVVLRKGLVRNLELEDFKVLSAGSGEEAFEVILSHAEIDFVLSDIRMPQGDGIQLLEKIRAHNLKTPVVLLVSGFSEYSKKDVTDRGALDLMAKPADIDKIVELIRASVAAMRGLA